MKETTLNKLNKSLEKIFENSKEICEVLNNNTNLKLHKVAGLDDLNHNNFELFCSIEYDNFTEFMKEHGLKTQHIGSTSSFYFNSVYYDMYDYEYNGKINPRNLTKLICQNSGIDLCYISVDDNGHISDLLDIDFSDGTSATWEEYFLEEITIEAYIEDLNSEVERFFEEFNEIKLGYEYIEDFKSNQVERYKEFCKN